jgi:hypothetical protein
MFEFFLNIVATDFTLGTGRTIPTVAAVFGLVGVVLAALAFIRPALLRLTGPISMVLSLISLAVGGLHAAYAAGGVGTGNGLAGAVVAVILGVLGIALGSLAYSRARRIAQ